MRIKVTPSELSGIVAAPPSKSYTHRAVILATLATGDTVIENPLISDDTLSTINACRVLGAGIQQEANLLRIAGTGGRLKCLPEGQLIFVGNSGSTIRMIAPLVALTGTRVILDGGSQLRQRPMHDLLVALKALGIRARSLNRDGYLPIEIEGNRLAGNEVSVSGSVSSQHISALLMIAPHVEGGLQIKVFDGLRSRPYVSITIDIMQRFGVSVNNCDYKEFHARDDLKYTGINYRVEGDYSQASYFLAAGAIGKSPVTVENLSADSVQGDSYLLAVLSTMGCAIRQSADRLTVSRDVELRGITLDMSDYPDIVQTVAIVAAFARGKTLLHNIGHLRFKETDRILYTAQALNNMGITTEITGDTFVIYGGKPCGAGIITHADHRTAMSFVIASLFASGTSIIENAESVAKSFPRFFTGLRRLGAQIEELP